MQIAHSRFFVSVARSSLEGDELVLWNGVRLIPGIGLVGAGTPTLSLFDGVAGQVGQRGVGGALQDRESIGIASPTMRVHQATHKLVVAISWEPVVFVESVGDRLGIQTV